MPLKIKNYASNIQGDIQQIVQNRKYILYFCNSPCIYTYIDIYLLKLAYSHISKKLLQTYTSKTHGKTFSECIVAAHFSCLKQDEWSSRTSKRIEKTFLYELHETDGSDLDEFFQYAKFRFLKSKSKPEYLLCLKHRIFREY